jgi:hypothetical protein
MEQSLPKMESGYAAREAKTEIVRNTIKDALRNTGAFTTGVIGTLAGAIPGTPAFNLARQIDTIKANIGFDELQNMRDSSPTGGALGQVAVKELEFLQATLGNLDRSQNSAELKKRLEQVDKVLERYQRLRLETFKKDYGRAPNISGTSPDQDPGSSSGVAPASVSGVDKQALDWANSNPNDPRSAAIKQRLGVR